jgi:peptidyl-prolyl cis-trans isomerase B (cyclophilin B)
MVRSFSSPIAPPHTSTEKHTVFGEVTEGQNVVDSIKGGDLINEVVIHGDTTELFEIHKDRIADWSN